MTPRRLVIKTQMTFKEESYFFLLICDIESRPSFCIMGLRDRIASAITGLPAPGDPQTRQIQDGGRSSGAARPGRDRAYSTTSVATARGRGPQLALEDSSTSTPDHRSRSQQLVTRGSFNSALTPTRAPQQNTLRDSTANLLSTRALPEPEPEPIASTSALPVTRISRPYGSSGNQEVFTLNPSRRLAVEGAGERVNTRSTASARTANRVNASALPNARRTAGEDDLAPLSDREIIDVTDENIVPTTASAITSPLQRAQENRSRQTARALNTSTTRPVLERKRSQQTFPTPDAFRAAPNPQQNDVLTRMPSSFTSRNRGYLDSDRLRRDAAEPLRLPCPGIVRPMQAQASRSRLDPATQVSGQTSAQPQSLYLGVFDLEENDQSTQPHSTNNADVPSRRGSSARSSAFDQWSTSAYNSSSVHHTTVINQGYGIGIPVWRPYFPSRYHPYEYGHDWHPGWVHHWGGLPWSPRSYFILPRQTVFTEIASDYFEQESSIAPNLDTNQGLQVINRYYNGWRDAYTEALLLGDEAISAADRTRIQSNRDNLQSKQDEAIRKLRYGDQAVVKETLDQVKMDMQMAVDMPVAQARWATPWIKEVWTEKHGQIPN